MAALAIQIPVGRLVDENGNPTPEFLILLNQLLDTARDHEERIEALEP